MGKKKNYDEYVKIDILFINSGCKSHKKCFRSKPMKHLFSFIENCREITYICHGTLGLINKKSIGMNTISNRSGRIKAHLKNSLAQSSLSNTRLYKSIERQNKENKAMMEMWDYYQKFTRLEF